MTFSVRYTARMTLFSFDALLTVQGRGALYAALLLAACLAAVHLFRLVRLGLSLLGKKQPKAPDGEKKPPEPVYYLVERKKKRPRSEYSEPRRIDFK